MVCPFSALGFEPTTLKSWSITFKVVFTIQSYFGRKAEIEFSAMIFQPIVNFNKTNPIVT